MRKPNPGGLVDHNNLKGICWRKANELGIKHARYRFQFSCNTGFSVEVLGRILIGG
jgi:hypothetical protein